MILEAERKALFSLQINSILLNAKCFSCGGIPPFLNGPAPSCVEGK